MAGFKITGFRGIAPKISEELLPEAVAQIANNCKLYSGELKPYPEPVVAGNTLNTDTVQTIYPLYDPEVGPEDHVWLSWDTEVNVATPSFSDNADEQRFYYTGDGVPKVSTYDLAIQGGGPYPYDYYELGLPLPEDKPVATVTSFTTKTVSSVARDAGGIATYTTSTAHGLITGVQASISGFTFLTGTYSRTGTTITVTITAHKLATGSVVTLDFTSGTANDGIYVISNVTADTFDVTDSDTGATSGNVNLSLSSYNGSNLDVTATSSTTFTVYSPGFQQTTYAISTGQVDLGGDPIVRQYVYTWYTPWGEESIASEPSDYVVVKEGQIVTITDLPISKPTDPEKNNIQGIRLYRTLTSEDEADFFFLMTLWFPQYTASVSRTNNVSSVTMAKPHNFLAGDRFKLVNCTDTSFDITDGIVVDADDPNTFTYNQYGTDTTSTADTTGILYHDIAEDISDTARYWGLNDYSFTDDFDAKFLTSTLESDEYAAPPEDLTGLKLIQNNILVGFVRNALYFSEPSEPHAWPTKYIKAVDNNIVAIEPISGVGAIVLTEAYPFLISGNDPANMSIQRIDALYPCVSSRGVVPMSFGVLYPTNEGLSLYSAATGPKLITAQMYEQDTWSMDYDPSTIVAVYYGDAYLASHSTGGFVFQYDPQTQGTFVTIDQTFDAAFNDKLTNRMFFADGVLGNVYEWDDLDQPNQTLEWKSKAFITKDVVNMGAARVVADYETGLADWDELATDWEDIDDNWDSGSTVTFKLWADRELKTTVTVTDSKVFRLPTGYRSDTYEFSISSDIRIRSVHIAETPLGLKEV